ncbi:MAG: hypothetical protein AB7T48_05810 [Solirubrobacterales bacterium]
MRRFAPILITFSALMPAVVPVLPSRAAGILDARPESAAAPLRTECATPGALSLRRFEDGSAQLLCAGRVLVRVSVPR